MNNFIGICTCGNHISSKRTFVSLITEYSQPQIDTMLDSAFGKIHNYELNLIYDNLIKAIENKNQSILLENASNNYQSSINELALWLSHKWKPGDEIKIKFLNRDPYLEHLVKEVTNEWMLYANIRFVFVEMEYADVRIEFTSDNSYWSQVGTLCRNVKNQDEPTMHLGAANLGINEEEIKGTFLHEFGHVLGCIHEHQHPDFSDIWDEDKVLNYFSNLGWDENKIRHNVINKLPSCDLTNSNYDPDSIMHYFFPSELSVHNTVFKLNTTLSQKDKDFIMFCYPFN